MPKSSDHPSRCGLRHRRPAQHDGPAACSQVTEAQSFEQSHRSKHGHFLLFFAKRRCAPPFQFIHLVLVPGCPGRHCKKTCLQAAKSVSSIAGYSHGRRYHAGAASTHLKVCEGGILQSNGCWLCCKLYVLVHLFVCARALHLNLEPKIPDLPTWSEGFHNHMLWSGRMY